MEIEEMMGILTNSFNVLQKLEMAPTPDNSFIMNNVYEGLRKVYHGLEDIKNAKGKNAGTSGTGTDGTGTGSKNGTKANPAGRDKN